MEIMHEFHGSTGEPIVEWNLSYRLSDLPWWLCTHHSPLSSWVPILCPSEGVPSRESPKCLAYLRPCGPHDGPGRSVS